MLRYIFMFIYIYIHMNMYMYEYMDKDMNIQPYITEHAHEHVSLVKSVLLS
jgi:hypothetical protein